MAGVTRSPTDTGRLPETFSTSAFDAYAVGLVYWEPSSSALFVNARFSELTGLGPGWVDDGFARITARIHPDDRDAFRMAVERLRAGTEEIHAVRRIYDLQDAERWMEVWARSFRGPDGEVVGIVGAFADVTGMRAVQVEREEQGEWVSRLLRITAGLAVAGGVDDVVEIVAGPVAEAVGGRHASVRLLAPDGERLVVAGWTGPEEVQLAPIPLDVEMPIAIAARTGDPVFDWTIGDIVRRFPGMREAARLSGATDGDLAVAVPLRAPHGVIGVLAITLPEEIALTQHRKEFLLSASAQAAQVVERARAFEAEQRAHRDAEVARGRVEFLAEVTELLAASTDVDATLQLLAALTVPRLADWCFVELVEEGGLRNVATAAVDPDLGAWVAEFRERTPPTGPFYREAIEERRTVLLSEVADEDLRRAARTGEHLDDLRKLDARSSIVAPLLIGDRAVGLINLVTGRGLSGRALDAEDVDLVSEVARRAALALENAMLHASERAARIEAEDFAWRVLRLQRVTSALSGALRPGEVVDVMLEEAVEAVGARGGALFALEGDGLRRLGAKGYGPPEGSAQDALAGLSPDTAAEYLAPLREAAADMAPLWVGSASELVERWPEVAGAWEALGERSCVVIPLLLETRVVGLLYLGFLEERVGTEADSDFLITLGRQCAQALERARLYEEEQERRALESATRRRIQHLHAITQAGLEHLRLDDSLHRMLELVVDAVGGEFGAVLLDDEEGRGPVVRALVDDGDEGVGTSVDRRRVIDITATPLADVLRGTPFEEGDLVGIAIPPYPVGRVRSVIALPLRVSGRVLGCLHVGSSGPGRFGEDEHDLVRLAAEQIAIAVDRTLLFEREHRIAEVLQRSLLPERLPEVRGMELAARYLPGSTEAQVGGDWYEVLELADGQIVMAVGDVVGSGVPAAATMGQFRNSLRALALEGLGVGRVLERLNELALGLEGEFATALLMVLEPATGMLRYASAGHPPALVVRKDGATALLADANATPLGVEPGTAYLEAVYPLDPGDTVLLYTDGLVERRGEPLDVGFERLRATAPGTGDVETLVTRVLEGVAPLEDREDDIAILALRYLARPLRFELSLPPVAASVSAFRTALGNWLAEVGVAEADALDLTLAVSEVCSNAIEHAGGSSAEVELMAEIRGGDAMLSVRDGGRWRPPSLRPERGRGFLILRHVMDSVEVRRRPGGTEVRMHRRLGAPA